MKKVTRLIWMSQCRRAASKDWWFKFDWFITFNLSNNVCCHSFCCRMKLSSLKIICPSGHLKASRKSKDILFGSDKLYTYLTWSNFSKCVHYTLKRHSREVTIITWQQQQQKVGPTTRKQFRDLARAVGCSTVTVKFIIFSGPHISSLLRFAAFLASNVCRSHYLHCTLESELEA